MTLFSRLNPLLGQEGLVQSLGRRVEHGRTVSLDLTLPTPEQRTRYGRDVQRRLRRLEGAGFTCVLDPSLAAFDDFVSIYQETMHRVGAKPGYHLSRDYLHRLVELLGPQVRLFVTRRGKAVVSASLYLVTDKIAQWHLGGSCNDILCYSPERLEIDTARRVLQAEGARVLHLGGGVDRFEDTLFRFGRPPWGGSSPSFVDHAARRKRRRRRSSLARPYMLRFRSLRRLI